MEGSERPHPKVDVPTLLYIVYIAFFVGFFVWSFLMFGFLLITFAFLFFVVLVVIMIDFTSRIIYKG